MLGAETLSEQSTILELVKRKKGPIFVFDSIGYYRECSLDSGREWNATPGLLYQSSIPRS